jgi:hypothetical protein
LGCAREEGELERDLEEEAQNEVTCEEISEEAADEGKMIREQTSETREILSRQREEYSADFLQRVKVCPAESSEV